MVDKSARNSFLKTLAFALVAGVFVGIFDIWAFEMSSKYFFGGVFAGVIFILPFSITSYFWPNLWLLRISIWILSGGLAGFIWWLVIKPQHISVWVAIAIGFIFAIMWWLHERPSKGSESPQGENRDS